MQHHMDEFSVTDFRYTFGEVWRVVRNRRWHFLLPFCAVGSIAMIASLWVPRTYTATTVIKREHDPVLASMMGRAWTEPYGEMRKRIAGDLTDLDFLTGVLEELDLPTNLPRFENGELTPEGERRRRDLATRIAQGLTITPVETTPNRDVLTIRLALDEPAHLAEILSTCRDRYIQEAQKKTVRILRDVEKFFQAESERSRARLAGLQKQIIEFELKYPGIDPLMPDPTQTEQTSLIVERLDQERQRDELTAEREKLLARLAAAQIDGSAGESAIACTDHQRVNPRLEELEGEIHRLEAEIVQNKQTRLMTEYHPTIVRLRKTIEARQEELASLPRMIPRDDLPAEPVLSVQEQYQNQIAAQDTKLAAVTSRLKEIAEQIAGIERRRVQTADQRESYLKLRESAERHREELASWQSNLGPIAHLLAVEDSNRGLRFTTMQESTMNPRPISPDSRVVLLACLAIGVAVGALCVMLAELFDRSFQTVKQLSSSLTIPVIESVDEILTKPARRRRLVSQFVLMPAAAAGLLLALLTTGSLAYLSIERPSHIESLQLTESRTNGVAFGEFDAE